MKEINQDKKQIVKDDINFLEYPNWVVSVKNKATVLKMEKEHGTYEVTCPHGMPKHFDKVVLYCLLHKLYVEKNTDNFVLNTNRYELAKSIYGGTHFSKKVYVRIMEALKKWQAISINFDGLFYCDGEYTTRGFGIINEYTLHHKSGELSIEFNKTYAKQLQETKYYKLIDFEQYKKLHKTSSARLYEILIKNFKDRNEWVINLQLLAEKMTFEKQTGAKNYYASDVIRYLKPAINEINKKTDLFINFQYNATNSACIFKKMAKKKEDFVAATRVKSESKKDDSKKKPNLDDQMAACMQYFNSLTMDEQKQILEDMRKQPYAKFLPNEEFRIFTYMGSQKLWPQD